MSQIPTRRSGSSPMLSYLQCLQKNLSGNIRMPLFSPVTKTTTKQKRIYNFQKKLLLLCSANELLKGIVVPFPFESSVQANQRVPFKEGKVGKIILLCN